MNMQLCGPVLMRMDRPGCTIQSDAASKQTLELTKCFVTSIWEMESEEEEMSDEKVRCFCHAPTEHCLVSQH